MIKKVIVTILTVLTIYTVFTKTDYKDIIEVSYINSIGFDYDLEKEEFVVFVYMINNYHIGQTESSPSDTFAYYSFTQKKSIGLAIEYLRQNSNTEFEFGHLRSIIVKDTFFINDNAYKLLDFFTNNPRFFPTFNVYFTANELEEIYKVENFTETSAYYTLLVNPHGFSTAEQISLSQLLNDILIPDYYLCYPVIKCEENIFHNLDKPFNTLVVSGYAVITDEYTISSFSKENYPAFILFEELEGLTHQFDSTIIQINKWKVKYKVSRDKFQIKIKLEGTVAATAENLTINQIEEKLRTILTEQILDLFETMVTYKIDLFNINYKSHNRLSYEDIKPDIIISIN